MLFKLGVVKGKSKFKLNQHAHNPDINDTVPHPSRQPN